MVTAEDAGLVPYGVSPARYDETLFCHDKVRYVGDEIAAVAAVDLETALEAVSLIKVDYEELPAVFTPEEAMAEGAPQLHERFPGNLCAEVHQEFGDVEAAFKQCDLIRTDTFLNKRQDAAFWSPTAASPTSTFRAADPLHLHPGSPLRAADGGHGAGAARGQGAGGETLRGRRLRPQGGGLAAGAERLPAFHEDRQAGQDELLPGAGVPLLPRRGTSSSTR